MFLDKILSGGVLTLRPHAVRLQRWAQAAAACAIPAESAALEAALVSALTAANADEYARVQPWMAGHITGRPPAPPPAPGQAGCTDILPGLRAQPFWTLDDVGVAPHAAAEAAALAAAHVHARAAARRSAGFQPYRNPADTCGKGADSDSLGAVATTQGHWNVSYVDLHGMQPQRSTTAADDAEAAETCFPDVKAYIETHVPRGFGHTLVSCLAPRTRIRAHTGPANKKLRLYLPVVVPEGGDGCGLCVDGTERLLAEGSPIVFDDSFVHSAWNETEGSRYVLITDVWHPDLSAPEVEILSLMQTLHERQLQDPSSASSRNPYTTIANARAAGAVSNEHLFAGIPQTVL